MVGAWRPISKPLTELEALPRRGVTTSLLGLLDFLDWLFSTISYAKQELQCSNLNFEEVETLKDNRIGFVVMYSLTFFFANFGAIATIFVVPTEIFPVRLRSTCHGISVASGKAGAIVGAFGFLYATRNQDKFNTNSEYPVGIGGEEFIDCARCDQLLRNDVYVLGTRVDEKIFGGDVKLQIVFESFFMKRIKAIPADFFGTARLDAYDQDHLTPQHLNFLAIITDSVLVVINESSFISVTYNPSRFQRQFGLDQGVPMLNMHVYPPPAATRMYLTGRWHEYLCPNLESFLMTQVDREGWYTPTMKEYWDRSIQSFQDFINSPSSMEVLSGERSPRLKGRKQQRKGTPKKTTVKGPKRRLVLASKKATPPRKKSKRTKVISSEEENIEDFLATSSDEEQETSDEEIREETEAIYVSESEGMMTHLPLLVKNQRREEDLSLCDLGKIPLELLFTKRVPSHPINGVLQNAPEVHSGSEVVATPSATTLIRDYKVRPELTPFAQLIFDNYGDILDGCSIRAPYFRFVFLESVCKVLLSMYQKTLTDISQADLRHWRTILEDAHAIGVEIEWLLVCLDELSVAHEFRGRLVAAEQEKEQHISTMKILEDLENDVVDRVKQAELELRAAQAKLFSLEEEQ
ncbi:hypothetical protein HHK36_022203 [Tetracentron sinense]|uniref:Uncharacterized protein n=1 Tax=Tetracentron sinense TaxID=13715 RepID=A0A834YPE6_TETSI|nr:hypothetical protein HHK36_022203 [Tetracentron sinense]